MNVHDPGPDTSTLIAPDRIADLIWLELARGADWSNHPFPLLTLATVSPDGRPSARIMTNRGAELIPGRLWFYSHLDTPKIADLKSRQEACAVGYDPARGIQLRLAGAISLHSHGPIVDQHWRHIEEVSQWLFRLSPQQSAEAVGIDPRLPHDHDMLARGLTARSRAHFSVLEFTLATIDWHQADGTHQRRAALHARNGWKVELVG